MAEAPEVLNEDDLTKLQSAIQKAERAEQIAEMAEQAGLDVTQQKQRAKETRDQLLRIKNTFFPGR